MILFCQLYPYCLIIPDSIKTSAMFLISSLNPPCYNTEILLFCMLICSKFLLDTSVFILKVHFLYLR